MQVLLISMLRREANIFKLKYAFNQLKMQTRVTELQEKNFSFRNQSYSKEKPLDIELENKELYLKYMQEVLERKEKELMQFEEYLLKHKKQQDETQIQKSILNPLALTQLAQTLSKKVEVFRDIIEKYTTTSKNIPQLEKLAQSLELVQQTCQQNYNQLKETLLQNHQQLIQQKEQLSAKLSKLHELQSYQKYLNQLQIALQQKQYQIIQRESQLKSTQTNTSNISAIPTATPNYNTFVDQEQNSAHSQVSMRKRTKIFDNRNSSKHTQVSIHNKSSKIMQERSTEEAPICSIQQCTLNSNNHITQPVLVQQATQSTIDDQLLRNINRFNSEAHLLKFTKLWTKFSANSTKGNPQHRSLMFLYQWRLNTLFDQKIKDSVKQMVRWPRCLQPFGDLPSLNYAQLSLKKKKYLQNFMSFQRRLFQRKKIKCHLSSILKNKNRRERTAFYLYFKQFRQIAKIMSILQNPNRQSQALREVSSYNNQYNNTPTISKAFKQSRIVSNSSLLLTEDKSKPSIAKTKSNKSYIQNSQVRFKGKEASVDITKLKQYIKSQEENEAKLAIECLKTQSIYRICSVLTTSTNKLYNRFLLGISKQSDDKRMNTLQKVINGYEFKWQLFMAKIRVALTSNTNKIGHLQQLVAFIGSDK